MTTHCPLCQQDGGTVLWRNNKLRIILAEDADYPGLCRVIWNEHCAEMTDLPPDDRQYLMSVVLSVEQALRDLLQPDKINLASLGNMVPHLHWHVIPRFRDDRHFPNAIWGEPVRKTGTRSTRLDVDLLVRVLTGRLNKTGATAN